MLAERPGITMRTFVSDEILYIGGIITVVLSAELMIINHLLYRIRLQKLNMKFMKEYGDEL